MLIDLSGRYIQRGLLVDGGRGLRRCISLSRRGQHRYNLSGCGLRTNANTGRRSETSGRGLKRTVSLRVHDAQLSGRHAGMGGA